MAFDRTAAREDRGEQGVLLRRRGLEASLPRPRPPEGSRICSRSRPYLRSSAAGRTRAAGGCGAPAAWRWCWCWETRTRSSLRPRSSQSEEMGSPGAAVPGPPPLCPERRPGTPAPRPAAGRRGGCARAGTATAPPAG